MMKKDKLTDILINNKNKIKNPTEPNVYMAIVDSLTPLKTKFYDDDTAINVSTLNVFGLKVGSKVLMMKYNSNFVIIGVIGNVTQSYCMLTRTTSQSIPTSTNTAVDFSSGSIVLDPENMFDGTNKITVPADGLYNFNVAFRFQDSTASTTRIVEIHLNGSRIHSKSASPDGAGRYGVNLSLNLNLTKDDYLQVFIYITTTSISIGAYDNTYMSLIPLSSGSALAVNQDANNFKCSLIKNSAQTISSSSTTKVTFSSANVDYDPLDMFNDANDRIIVPSAGMYEISMCSRWETNTGDSDRIIYVYVNGTAIVSNVMNTGSAGRASNTITLKKYLYFNDYIEMYAWQDSGGDLDIGGTGFYNLYFSVEKCV